MKAGPTLTSFILALKKNKKRKKNIELALENYKYISDCAHDATHGHPARNWVQKSLSTTSFVSSSFLRILYSNPILEQ